MDKMGRVIRHGESVKEHDALWVLTMAYLGWSLG